MRNHFASLIVVLVFASITLAQNAKAPASQFDARDLSGIWSRNSQGFGGGGTCRDCGDRGFNNEVPPMTPSGEAKFNANKPSYGREKGSAPRPGEHIGRRRAVPPGQGNDIVTECNPSGLPRMLLYPDPIEITQTPNKLLQTFQWTHQWREIWTDGRELPKEPDLPRWYGYSVGKWDGNTFIVDSVGFDERTWVDHFGYPHSDEMRLQERYRRLDHDTLELTMTIDDPKTYTRPWTSEPKRFKLLSKAEATYDGWYGMLEEVCAPTDEVDQFKKRIVDPAGGKVSK